MSIVIYTKEDCAYCGMAKNLLKSKNIPFQEKVLSVDFTREELLANHSLAKTFPVVVVDGFYIGGYNNLVEHIERAVTTQVLLVETQPETVVASVSEVTTNTLADPEPITISVSLTSTSSKKTSR